jgi:3-hydroxyisobutyrate dehydrogenase-like beta-hydroxyacid dehydrogenase
MGSKVGIVGLGKMGRAMITHLCKAGHDVAGCDPMESARAEARSRGAVVMNTAAEVSAASDIVFIVVGFDAEVERVVFDADGLLAGAKPGLTIAIGSTIAPSYAFGLEKRLAGRGLILLDTPSTRGEKALEAGEILILGGGDETVFEQWTPIMRTFASDIRYLGPFGAGQVAKMVNNMILWACMSANDEGLRLAESLGVDPEKLREALHLSSAQNWSMSTRAEDRPMPWAEKDMTIALREADLARLSLPLAGCVKEVIKGYKIRRGIPMPLEVG